MSQRLDRINELLKREIGVFVERNFEFPDALVTIHAVETAADLKNARVHVGVIGSETQSAEAVGKLNGKRGLIQNGVMKRVTLRNTPVLEFCSDDSVERGVRILDILEEIGEVELDGEE